MSQLESEWVKWIKISQNKLNCVELFNCIKLSQNKSNCANLCQIESKWDISRQIELKYDKLC